MTHSYPYVPEGRSIHYVSAHDVYMSEAERVRDNESSDLIHPTGAVVVLGGTIIGRGANQSALKNKRLLQAHKAGWCMRRLLRIPSGQKYWLCPGCASFRHHAEARAVGDALSKTASVAGADLYLYGHWWCCKPCWDKMIVAGIHNVFLVERATELFK
jgi:deoxycytidylate deaminase